MVNRERRYGVMQEDDLGGRIAGLDRAGANAGSGGRMVGDVHAQTPRQRQDRKSTRLNSSHIQKSRMPSSA